MTDINGKTLILYAQWIRSSGGGGGGGGGGGSVISSCKITCPDGYTYTLRPCVGEASCDGHQAWFGWNIKMSLETVKIIINNTYY